jgi:large subunit ribosomal protein L19
MYNSSSRTTSTRFSGMLIRVRRGQGAKTFTLRNVIHKTGVEMTFPLGGPQIKDISVVLAANSSKYKHDAQGNLIYPRWPKNKAYNLDQKPQAWTERTQVALQVMRAQAQTDREMAKTMKQLATRRGESAL